MSEPAQATLRELESKLYDIFVEHYGEELLHENAYKMRKEVMQLITAHIQAAVDAARIKEEFFMTTQNNPTSQRTENGNKLEMHWRCYNIDCLVEHDNKNHSCSACGNDRGFVSPELQRAKGKS